MVALCGVNKKEPWSRVVYEKPFGYDLASARKLNSYINSVFCEESVFRIDHYLGKELIGNIAFIRFTNRIFEPLWNNKHIESVHILLSETIGVCERGAFYDSYGALKDMVQSHILQNDSTCLHGGSKIFDCELYKKPKGCCVKKDQD